MNRLAHAHLQEWSARPDRKPLIVRGARQVGKSHLIRTFGDSPPFSNILQINLERTPDIASLFRSNEPQEIVDLLSARFGTPVVPGQTLLFLDEVQATPELLATLRYFKEDLPALHVIAAGSLLDFALRDAQFSMPVGRIEYLHLGPMTFEEYLLARQRAELAKRLGAWSPGDEFPPAIHNELVRKLREFFVIGGMPASIATSRHAASTQASERIQSDILATYRDDFAKYGRQVDRHRLDRVFAAIPRLGGTKFKYSRVDPNERSRELKAALELLCLARVAHKVCHTSSNGIPLAAEADHRAFKVLFMDVGLFNRSLGLSLVDMESATDLTTIHTGAVAEQFIGQHLLHSLGPYENPQLHCWIREKSRATAELDFVLSVGQQIVPVEVKAGTTGTLKSLHLFLDEKDLDFGLRFNMAPPSLLDCEAGLATGRRKRFRLLSLPLYMVGQTRRLIRACQ